MKCIATIPTKHNIAATFSTQGHLIVGGGETKVSVEAGNVHRFQSLCLWETSSRELWSSLGQLGGGLGSVATSHDDRLIATIHVTAQRRTWGQIILDTTDTLIIWDAITGKTRLRWSDDRVGTNVVFHPTQDIFATCGNSMVEGKVSRKVIIADARNGTVLKELDHGQNYAYGLCFSPDGETLATGATDGGIRLWDVVSGHLKDTLQEHRHGIVSIAYAPCGKLLASGAWDFVRGQPEVEVILWKREPLRPSRLESNLTRIYSLAFSRDGRFLFTVGGLRRGEIEVWDTETEKRVWTGNVRWPYWQVACSPTEDLAVLTGQPEEMELWDFSGLRQLK